MTRSQRRTLNISLAITMPLLVLAAWWTLSANSTDPFFPPLQNILQRFVELWFSANFRSDVVPSLVNLGVGYLLASAGGIVLGFVIATFPLLRAMFEPIFHFLRGIPPVALIPILITLMGFGAEMRVASIFIAAIFPIMISTIDGIRSIDSTLKSVTTVYQLTRFERLSLVYLPSAGPQIAAGLQVGLQVAFVVMIASEMLGTSQGIGAMTLLAQQSLLATDMWAGILLLGLIGFLTNILFELIRSRILAWYIASKRLERAA